MSELEAIKAGMTTKAPPTSIPDDAWLSTGSTLLNLACSGRRKGGFFKGGVFFYVGRSGSGKTFYTLTCMAEACRNKHFKDYTLVYDPSENGAQMDFAHYYGAKMAGRVEVLDPPSRTLEEFFDRIDARMGKGPVIWVEDSIDALVTEAHVAEQQKAVSAREKGKKAKTKGSYGTDRAKVISARLRTTNNLIADTGSILILIGQTRKNIGFDAMFNPDTRAGGEALTFFNQHEIWTKTRQRIRREGLTVGKEVVLHVVKNRASGRDRTVVVPFIDGYGIDEVGSCVNFLAEVGRWKGAKKDKAGKKAGPLTKVDPLGDLGLSAGTPEEVVQQIQFKELEGELAKLTEAAWLERESKAAITRKPRYS